MTFKYATKRRETIITYLTNEIRARRYYIHLRRKKVYPRGFKTFHRDLKVLQEADLLNLEIRIGGKYGTTTFVSPKLKTEQ